MRVLIARASRERLARVVAFLSPFVRDVVIDAVAELGVGASERDEVTPRPWPCRGVCRGC